MPINPKRDDSVGIWTPFPGLAKGHWQDADGDEWYKVRPLTPSMMEHFEQMAGTIPEVNPKTRQVEFKRNDKRWRELLYDHLLEDWKLLTTDGSPWPCNLENKMFLQREYAQRVNWIVETASEYGNNDVARQEAEKASFRGMDQTAPGLSDPELSGVRGGDPAVAGAMRAVSE
jgi:hypothetical protein